MKIGFIDYYLDEWHANNYPAMLKAASGGRMEVACAYALADAPNGGMTTAQWCAKMGVRQCGSIAEVVERSDALVVLAPDNPETHLELCRLPFAGGKPTYVDKTFAPTRGIAAQLAGMAAAGGTPFFSSSSLRFARELEGFAKGEADFVLSYGPGEPDNYLIHLAEMAVAAIGRRPLRVMRAGGAAAAVHVEFAGGAGAVLAPLGKKADSPYHMAARRHDGSVFVMQQATGYFEGFIEALVRFFQTGQAPVAPEETVDIAGIVEKARQAAAAPGCWLNC